MEPKASSIPTVQASTPSAIRGALKFEVSTSEQIVNASGDFSIFVNVTNPYDIPVTLYAVHTHIPMELIDSMWVQKFKLAQQSSYLSRIQQAKGWRRGLEYLRYWTGTLAYSLRPSRSPRIAEAVSLEPEKPLASFPSSQTTQINGDVRESTIGILAPFSEMWVLKFPATPTNDELDRVFMKVEDFRAGKAPTVLQPGDSVVRQFVLKARRWLFFLPIEYLFQIQVRYAVDNSEHLNNIPFRLSVRSAPKAIMFGAAMGSTLGALARGLGISGGELSLQSFALSAILGTIAVVAFARKSNAQQIISVEDVWGGLLIGFLVGYSGESYFRKILGPD
jgi:hypothetical protein